MAFDECPPSKADRPYVKESVERTTRWLLRCKEEMKRLNALENTINKEQMLFGINQGAIYEDLRIEHAKRISELDLPGYAIGGLAVGESHEEMYRILDAVIPHLPKQKPTYLMAWEPRQIFLKELNGEWISLIVYILQGMEDMVMYTRIRERKICSMQNMKRMKAL